MLRIVRTLLALSLVMAVACGQKEASPDANKQGKTAESPMPSVTASFDNRVEFAAWLLEQARAGNEEGLMKAVTPFEYVMKLRSSKGFSKPTDQLRLQLEEKHRKHYEEQVRRFMARFKSTTPDQLNLVDIGMDEFGDEEITEIETQTRSGLHSDFGEVVIVRGDTTYKLRLFRYGGSWYAAELGG
ncbi:MAG TPA: hypothetical protein PLF13_01600 [candidate division Zixibacteria bacterium]|nr:hypothetical protein [candidate division Zixibacteria bacterium]